MMRIVFIAALTLSSCASAQGVKTETASKSAANSALADVPAPRIKPATTPAQDAREFELKFASWKQEFLNKPDTRAYGQDLVTRTIGAAKVNPSAIQKDQDQPEFSRSIWSYLDSAASDKRVKDGIAARARTQPTLNAIDARYQVDPDVLVAIWGLESSYGKILGTQSVIDSLATLAAQGRRQGWAESQLYAILDMLQRGDVRQDQLVGSWAGAMGMTQFIPTTFRDYAVDFDGNGNKDLWKNSGDALGSAAHYLSRYGWRRTEPILVEVKLPNGFDYNAADGSKYTIADWSGMGVAPASGQHWTQNALFLDAKLLVPAGAKGPIFLTFKNFDVIKRYNNSTSYALGITLLSQKLNGQNPISTPWPRNDKPISRTDKIKMQEALTAQGYDTKGADGIIGPNSRRAIRAWQTANGLPADGYVDQVMLAKILAR